MKNTDDITKRLEEIRKLVIDNQRPATADALCFLNSLHENYELMVGSILLLAAQGVAHDNVATLVDLLNKQFYVFDKLSQTLITHFSDIMRGENL